VNSVNTLTMATMALLFLGIAFRISQKAARLEHENEVLWDQVHRYEAYIQDRAAEDEMKQRAAVRN